MSRDPGRHTENFPDSVLELRGTPCGDLVLEEPDHQQIVVSRTFGRDVEDPDTTLEALATFTTQAFRRLRQRSLAANGIWVFLAGNHHKDDSYSGRRAISFPYPTRDPREGLSAVRVLFNVLHRPGQKYKRAGAGLLDLGRAQLRPADLFSAASPRGDKAMTPPARDRVEAHIICECWTSSTTASAKGRLGWSLWLVPDVPPQASITRLHDQVV